jgi:hypothetical protein
MGGGGSERETPGQSPDAERQHTQELGRTPAARSAQPSGGGLAAVSNQAMLRTLSGVSRPEDAHEQEAARTATTASSWASGPAGTSPPPAGLDPIARRAMVGLFGDPFDDVTLHSNRAASRVADAVGASAVTAGRDVFFAAGRYQPDTPSGQRLLVHELAHTRQAPAAPARLHRDGTAVKRTYMIEASEPEVFLFAGTATKEQISSTLYGDPELGFNLRYVPTQQQKLVDGVTAQGTRPKNPAALTTDCQASLRSMLDIALTKDIDQTISLLSERSIGSGDEASLAELTLRWSQRSDIPTTGGGSYFDAYLGALNRRQLIQPHWYTLGQTETTKTALQWLLAESGSSSEQIEKAIELRSSAFRGTTGYTVTDRTPELQTGDFVGRFYWSNGGGTTQVRILETIGEDSAEEPTARLVQRRLMGKATANGLGAGVVVPSPAGGYIGYLVDFNLLDDFAEHPFQDEMGHYYWYYPGTRLVAIHELWDAATKVRFEQDVRAQSTDWTADLIGMEASAIKIRANAPSWILSKPLLDAWLNSDRAMIEMSGNLAAKKPVDRAKTVTAARAFFDQARAAVKSLDDIEEVSDTAFITVNPYLTEVTHTFITRRLETALTAAQWRQVLTDYHSVGEAMDNYVASRLRATGGEKGKAEALQLEYSGAAARKLDALILDHPNGRRIRATFYPLDSMTADQEGLGEAVAAPMDCLFYVYREGSEWHLDDLTTPRKEKVTEASGGTDTMPAQKLFTKLNTRLRFPRGRLYWEMPDGTIWVMTTTEPKSFADWLKSIGMTLGLLAMLVGTAGTSLPATLLMIGSALAGAAGTAAELYEKADAGVLTQADVFIGVVDIIAGLAQAGSAATGHIIRTSALKTGAAARFATSLDKYVYRQLVGVSLFGQTLSFVVTTQQILDEYYKAKAAADANGSDLALRRLLMHIFMSGGMLLMSGKADLADITRGRTLKLGNLLGDDIALSVRPSAKPDAVHEEWVQEMLKLEHRAPTGPRTGAPLEPGMVGKYEDAHAAYEAYDATLRRPGEAEVGVFRNGQGEYVVMIGKATAVDPPEMGGPWRAVVHYHSNPGHALTMRMPAAADVEGAIAFARETGRPVTEFVESPLPGGGRGITAYTVTPDGKITIEYVRPNGERITQPYEDLSAYRTELNSRDVMLDPTSPHYREVMEDLGALYSGTGNRAAGARTAMGTGWEGALEAVAGKAAREELTKAFAAHPGKLESLVNELGPVEVSRLSTRLGPTILAEAGANLSGTTIRYLSNGLDAAEVSALLKAHDPAHITWAARAQNGPAAREVLALPTDVLNAVANQPGGGIPAMLVRPLMSGPKAIPPAQLHALLTQVPSADLVLLRQHFGDEGFLQLIRTDDRPAVIQDFAGRQRAGVGVELANPAPLPSDANILDTNLLIPLQNLRAGAPWNSGVAGVGLHEGDRRRVTDLSKRFGVPFAKPEPTQAEIETLMAAIDNRLPSTTLAEAPVVPGASRGTAMIVNRNDPVYAGVMREMATLGEPIGKAEGGTDRSFIADALFAQRAPGATPPVVYTDDLRIVRPLVETYGVKGTYVDIGTATKKEWPGKFATANPTGFEIEVRGRRVRIVFMR